MNEAFIYCLATVSARFGVQVHAAVLMSTHEHIIVTDTRGELPRFLQELHRLFALVVKVLRKWDGAVWDHHKTSVVELRTPHAIVEKLAYIMANPVAAGLVREPAQWPGVRTLPADIGRVCWHAKRPTAYFAEDNSSWPATASLRLSVPPVGDLDLESCVAAELGALKADAHASARAKGWQFLSARQLTRLPAFKRALSWAPLRGRNPTFAVGRGQREAFAQAVYVVREFRRRYREALEAWRQGLRKVCFPAETWHMRWAHAVETAAIL